jgi:hypothetical protein
MSTLHRLVAAAQSPTAAAALPRNSGPSRM